MTDKYRWAFSTSAFNIISLNATYVLNKIGFQKHGMLLCNWSTTTLFQMACYTGFSICM